MGLYTWASIPTNVVPNFCKKVIFKCCAFNIEFMLEFESSLNLIYGCWTTYIRPEMNTFFVLLSGEELQCKAVNRWKSY